MDAWSVPGYREERVLGSGGSGRVVLAVYNGTGAYVAIKYLSDELRSDPRFLAAFREEARTMVEIGDPNIVRFYEYVESPLGAAIVMELVNGVPLRKILHEHGTTSPEAALVVLKGSLLGLSAAHAAGIVHRDYKPENVLVQADGFSKLADFGIATPAGRPGLPSGTPPYMAPEQWNGSPAGPATDVYAATCVFFECLTGQRPYRADHPAALMRQHQSAAIPAEAVPGSVRGLVTRGLAKNPADRPSTARAFVGELESAAVAAYGPEWEERGRRHLAELVALLAFGFPLSEPGPQASTSLASTVLRGPLRPLSRVRHPGRVLVGAGVVAVGVVIAVLAAGRGGTPVRDVALTTSPTARAVAQVPAGEPSKALAKAPVTSSPDDGTDPPESSPSPSHATHTSPAPAQVDPPATPQGTPGTTHRPTHRPTPTPTRTPTRTPTPTPTPSPSPTPSPTPTPTPTPTPSPTPTPTPTPMRLSVRELAVAAFDGRTATVRVRTSTAQTVTLSVRFTERSSGGALAAPAAPVTQTFTLTGSTSYTRQATAGFAAPACGKTVYRQVTVSTTPGAAGGSRSRTVMVKGDPCPPPTVDDVSVRWNGKTARVGVRTGGTGEVRLAAAFTRRQGEGAAKVVDQASRTLSGDTSYALSLSGDLGEVACGETAYFGVRVTTTPAAANGTQFKEVGVDGPKCAPPTVSITSWDGGTLRVRVRSSSPDPVRLTASFQQTVTAGERTITRTAARRATLSGDSVYDRVFTVRFADPRCGYVDVRKVTVTVASALGTASDSATRTRRGRACAEPTPEPTKSDPPTEEPPDKDPPKDPPPSPEPRDEPSGDSGDGPVLT
ncbi:protein kinase [Sphaerisporangium sp. NPDC005289]|uniref:serine/threonine-protein kinase n=1 Tax=Sphaerisporangium sp. NPDC005289 TaxID=3155247 RepID=UPI0033BDA3DF